MRLASEQEAGQTPESPFSLELWEGRGGLP